MSDVAAPTPESPAALAAPQQFERRMLDMLNAGALGLMVSIGHRTALFDAMAPLPPSSVDAIADAAKLNARYVREWLGAMVTGGIVEHDPATETYCLPPAHAACLTRAATPNNLAVFAQYLPLLGGVEDDIVACFKYGGGVPYSRFGRFHEVMAEDSGQSVLPALREHILPLVPGLIDRLHAGIDVADFGCGRGLALVQLAVAYPRSRFTGFDLSADAIDFARAEAAKHNLANLRFEVRDLTRLDTEAIPQFDFAVTFDAVHDQADPAALLRGIRRSLKSDGVYLAQDINGSSHVHANCGHPIGTLLYTISCLHCMTVSLAQDGAGLGAMWGREMATQMMNDAGFAKVAVHELAHDIQNCYYVCKV